MIVLAIFLILSIEEPKFPPGYSCEDVRKVVAERGKVAALALAIESGLSLKQISLIRRTCKV